HGGGDTTQVARQRGQRAAKIVCHRKYILCEALDAVFSLALDVLLGAPADVLSLGPSAQKLVLQLRLLGLQALQLALALRLGLALEVRIRHLGRGVARG